VRLYHGDVIEVLRRMPAKSVQTVVTSPPYWGLRDYGVKDQIGLEKTPQEYVRKMVEVFAEVHRVLRDDGTLWLNLGDTYGGGKKGNTQGTSTSSLHYRSPREDLEELREQSSGLNRSPVKGLAAGNLVGIPWRVAFALQEWGWVLRQDIIWHKPSPMPESVRNRCTKAHEYIFLFAKSQRYFYDAEAVKEETNKQYIWRQQPYKCGDLTIHHKNSSSVKIDKRESRNKHSVWTVAGESYSGAHFATFPRKLITPCVLAGTSEKGACAKCGAPLRRVVETGEYTNSDRPSKRKAGSPHEQGDSMLKVGGGCWPTKTKGWEKTCDCKTRKTRPCVVLDPFVGSGTTCVVSIVNGRHCWGIDLSKEYLDNNAVPRIEGALLDRPALAPLLGYGNERMELGRRVV